MTTGKKQLDAVKCAYYGALQRALACADEALGASDNEEDLIDGTDGVVLPGKAQQALKAFEDWQKAADKVTEVMSGHFEQFRSR